MQYPKHVNFNLLSTLICGITTVVLTGACGSENPTIASLSPDQETTAADPSTSLQITTRPVIYRPSIVLGSLTTLTGSVTLTGTGFAGVDSVTFLGGPGDADDVDANFTVIGDNRLTVNIPGNPATGLIRVSTPFNAAYRLYVAAPQPEVPPSAPDLVVSSSSDCGPLFTTTTGFGDPPVGTSVTRSFVICNLGNTTLEVENARLSEPDPSGDGIEDFAITSQTQFEVAPGSFASLTVQCTPSEEVNDLRTDLRFETNDPDSSSTFFSLFCR